MCAQRAAADPTPQVQAMAKLHLQRCIHNKPFGERSWASLCPTALERINFLPRWFILNVYKDIQVGRIKNK